MSFGDKPRLYQVPDSSILYAGRTDLNCVMLTHLSSPLKRKTTIDFKTGKKPKPKDGYPEWKLQTAAYRNGSGTQGNGVVHLDKETGEMTWYDYSGTYQEDLEAFLHLVRFWRNRNMKLLDGKNAPSATTVTGICDKSGPLIWWAVNSMRDYLLENKKPYSDATHQEEYLLLNDFYSLVESARKNFRKVGQKAMDIGTQSHDVIEQWIKTGIEPPKGTPDEVIASFVAFLDWWEEYKVEAIETEAVIYGK